MWDLPGPGLEPVSPVLTGGFLITAPPEKSLPGFILELNFMLLPRVHLLPSLPSPPLPSPIHEWQIQ